MWKPVDDDNPPESFLDGCAACLTFTVSGPCPGVLLLTVLGTANGALTLPFTVGAAALACAAVGDISLAVRIELDLLLMKRGPVMVRWASLCRSSTARTSLVRFAMLMTYALRDWLPSSAAAWKVWIT